MWKFVGLVAISTLFVFSALAGPKKEIPIIDLNEAKSALPKLPFLAVGCQGECCGALKSNKLKKDLTLVFSPNNHKKVRLLKKGESFEEADWFTLITKFGSVKENGKKVTVVIYGSEGISVVWDGKAIRTAETMDEYKDPESQSWVRIKTKDGKVGWADEPPGDDESAALDHGWCG